ncbi:MAG: CvpA family protein [Holosporaceae bacterium]|jgi:membrane protein required for colicin V production|nr:CvpA family protein [Holosporaceae bacterium]
MRSGEFFNLLDYACIAIMLLSTLTGFVRGFVKDFFSSCAWFGSGFLAVFIAPHLVPAISKHIPDIFIARCSAIIIAYLTILIILLLIISAISKNVQQGVLSGIDKAVGVLFGFSRGVIILICSCIVMLLFDIRREKYKIIQASKFSVVLFKIAELWMPHIPKLSGDLGKKLPLAKRINSLEEEEVANAKIAKIDKKRGKEGRQESIIRKRVASKSTLAKERTPIIEESREEKAEERSFLQKIKDYLENWLASRRAEEKITGEIQPERHSSHSSVGKEKPKFGAMSLQEAKARRRERRRAEKLQKQIQKRLDNEGV